ncbi:hypothetical protein [Streptomyces sp. NPDC057302]|uniref:hypothetical protein n=1 Tax=Streptomyces sp. NPDC057302 TaxID=3346094 RepID=UPI00362BD691
MNPRSVATYTASRTEPRRRGGVAGRLTRSTVFAAVCVSVTAPGHALMSGHTLPAWAVWCAFAAVAATAWCLTGRPRGALAVCGASVLTQLALHSAFTLSQTAAGPGPAPSTAPRHSGAGMAHMRTGQTESGFEAWAGMTSAHALAGLLCGLWLWRGEAAARRIGRALAAFVFAPLDRAVQRPSPLPGHQPSSAVPLPLPGPRLPLLRHVVSRRGPPRRPNSV